MDNAHRYQDPVTWTPEAQSRLQQVPQGVMRELTRQRVEEMARRRGQSIVTVELMGNKYHQWAEGSAQATSEMAWTEEAQQRVERIPAFVRGMVAKAIEAYAVSRGRGSWRRPVRLPLLGPAAL